MLAQTVSLKKTQYKKTGGSGCLAGERPECYSIDCFWWPDDPIITEIETVLMDLDTDEFKSWIESKLPSITLTHNETGKTKTYSCKRIFVYRINNTDRPFIIYEPES